MSSKKIDKIEEGMYSIKYAGYYMLVSVYAIECKQGNNSIYIKVLNSNDKRAIGYTPSSCFCLSEIKFKEGLIDKYS